MHQGRDTPAFLYKAIMAVKKVQKVEIKKVKQEETESKIPLALNSSVEEVVKPLYKAQPFNEDVFLAFYEKSKKMSSYDEDRGTYAEIWEESLTEKDKRFYRKVLKRYTKCRYKLQAYKDFVKGGYFLIKSDSKEKFARLNLFEKIGMHVAYWLSPLSKSTGFERFGSKVNRAIITLCFRYPYSDEHTHHALVLGIKDYL